MRSFVLTAAVALLAACGAAQKLRRAVGGGPERTPSEQEVVDEAIRDKRIILGMTKSEVRQVRGEPIRRDTTTFLGGDVRRWMYAWDEVYFDATGVVVGMRRVY